MCASSTKVTEVAAVLPKNTDKWPAAPEKFWPVMVMVLPAEPLVALRPVTRGVRFTTWKSPAVSDVQAQHVVHVPGQVDVVVGVLGGGGAGDVHRAADVREDQAVLLHGLGDDLGLGPHAR